nr:hypothetical protein [Dechloromonas sp.]
MDIDGLERNSLINNAISSIAIHQLREMRSTTDGLKNRQLPVLMDSAFSLMDAFSSLFSLFTKEKEREIADRPKKQAMDEKRQLMDKRSDLME